ncbi:unnamed protein product [Trifolium pratense]|uniref:Uncharacterized protein n=1 Tax=Trifolium pratense TaxID=57577 RepID=A0ACB0IMH7_TRIPR|nr:unnamed protein product [Trifolium pratense]
MAMAMSSDVFISFILLIVTLSWLCTFVNGGSNSTTIYDELRAKGLPVGLLPKGITRYEINSSSGEFQIGELSGMTAQELFLWFPVKGIHVDLPSSGLIHFDVGVADKQFSLSLFEDPPDCNPQVYAINDDVLRAVW